MLFLKSDKLKGLVAGLLLGSILSGTAVFAASGSMIEVFYNVKSIKIDKVIKKPNEQPFFYKGTAFVPLRFVAEALGETVKWDSTTQTILIGDPVEDTAVYPGKGIELMNHQSGFSLNSIKYEYDLKTPVKDNVGNEYSNYLKMGVYSTIDPKDSWNKIEFPLKGEYKSFKAKLGITDASMNTVEELTLTVYLDNAKVLEKKLVAGDFPEDLSIDVKNAKKISFQLNGTTNAISIESEIGLFDARFIK